jgi:hypothetical protein
VILEHSVLGLHTCLVPVLLSSPLLSCIPCLGSALQYILRACSVHSFPVCITSTSILASLRCTCFDIARQILSTPCRHSGQTPHRPSRTLRPTDRNKVGVKVEAEVTDPSQYQMLDAPLTRSKRKALGTPEESHLQSRQASNTIEARLSSHSVSETNTAVKRRRVTSAPTLTPLTHL